MNMYIAVIAAEHGDGTSMTADSVARVLRDLDVIACTERVGYNAREKTFRVVLNEPKTREDAPAGSHSFADGWLLRDAMEEVRRAFERPHVVWQEWVRDEFSGTIKDSGDRYKV